MSGVRYINRGGSTRQTVQSGLIYLIPRSRPGLSTLYSVLTGSTPSQCSAATIIITLSSRVTTSFIYDLFGAKELRHSEIRS